MAGAFLINFDLIVTIMFSIREMRIEDAEQTAEVLRETMLHSWEHYEKDHYPKQALEFDIAHNSAESLKERFASPENFGFVAEEDKEIVATAFGRVVGESGLASLGWIGVHPDYQRKGIGKALLQRVIEYCTAKRCHKIILYTLPVLVPAVNLYLKCVLFQKPTCAKNGGRLTSSK